MTNSIFGLENKTVVITGASGGVGGASAKLFAQVGANVALLSRRGADELAKQIVSEGGVAKSYKADVSSKEQMKKTFEDIVADFGPVYSLLNISGVCEFYPPEATPLEKTEVDEKRWDHINAVNGKGVALAIHFATQTMKAGGTIVNVGSTAGCYGAEAAVIDYSYSKGGLVGMTMGYAKILSRLGIRINAVAPGPIAGTDMLSQADDSQIKALADQTRLGKLCRPEDIAQINLFLASNMSSVMTGETVDANCGQFISA